MVDKAAASEAETAAPRYSQLTAGTPAYGLRPSTVPWEACRTPSATGGNHAILSSFRQVHGTGATIFHWVTDSLPKLKENRTTGPSWQPARPSRQGTADGLLLVRRKGARAPLPEPRVLHRERGEPFACKGAAASAGGAAMQASFPYRRPSPQPTDPWRRKQRLAFFSAKA